MAEETKDTKKASKPAAKSAAAPKKAPAKKAESAPAAAKKPEAAKKPAPAKAEKKAKAAGKTVTITQIGSPIGRQAYQRSTLVGLGLNKMHKTNTLEDTTAVRGMIRKVGHLVKVEDAA